MRKYDKVPMLNYNLSYWERETFFKDIDLAIIGSGIVGLAAAIHAKTTNPNLQVAILERGTLPIGASTRNAGFACLGSMTELLDDLSRMTEDDVLALVEQRWRGLHLLRSIVGDQNMDFEMLGGYELFTDDEESVFQECLERMPDLNQKMASITGVNDTYQPVDECLPSFGFHGVRHLILNRSEGQVHTGKMMKKLLELAHAKGVRIFNGIGIRSITDTENGVQLETDFGWQLHAPKVLVAVNGFAKRLLPDIDVIPARNQVLITKKIPNLAVKGCFHYDRGYYYFRNIDGRILLGGGRFLAFEEETTDQFGSNEMIRSALAQLLHTVICPEQKPAIDSWWSGILGLGPIKKPIIEKVSSNVVVSVRLSGMGVAIGSLVGRSGADLVMG
jgi:glycine/D-amino acid oxidase-like deaminating enzyme